MGGCGADGEGGVADWENHPWGGKEEGERGAGGRCEVCVTGEDGRWAFCSWWVDRVGGKANRMGGGLWRVVYLLRVGPANGVRGILRVDADGERRA